MSPKRSEPGKVKGRGRVGVRFTRITPLSDNEQYRMQTRSWVAVAPATKKKDALTIGLPAAGGAVIGALIDGKKGAGIGAAAGGGAGTAAVLTTRGKDVRVGQRRGAVGPSDVSAHGQNRRLTVREGPRWALRVRLSVSMHQPALIEDRHAQARLDA